MELLQDIFCDLHQDSVKPERLPGENTHSFIHGANSHWHQIQMLWAAHADLATKYELMCEQLHLLCKNCQFEGQRLAVGDPEGSPPWRLGQVFHTSESKLCDLEARLASLEVDTETRRNLAVGEPPAGIAADNILDIGGPNNDALSCGQGEVVRTASAGSGSSKKQEYTKDISFKLTKEFSVWRFSNTVWETIIFTGAPGLGIAGSCILLFSILFNLVLQTTFCIVALTSVFSDYELPEPASARTWRFTAGHSAAQSAGWTSWFSLADRVCAQDDSLTVSTAQVDLLKGIEAYTTPIFSNDRFPAFCVGQVLCAVTLFAWLFVVSKELHIVVESVMAVGSLPRSRHKMVLVITGRDKVAIQSVSAGLFFSFAAVALVRLVIAVLIGFAGASWLANTAELSELVLNAVALAFVMDLDELIFSIMVPPQVHVLFRQLKPIQKPWGGRRSISLHCLLNILGCIFFVFFFLDQQTMPMIKKMKDIEFEMCHGQKGFVVGVNPNLNLAIVSDTTPFSQNASQASSLLNIVIDEAISHSPGNSINQSMMHGIYSGHGREQFLASMSIGMDSADSYADFYCEDDNVLFGRLTAPFSKAFWTSLGHLVGDPSVQHCSDLLDRCDDEDSALIRFACPSTCGCKRPLSGLMFSSGCESKCDSQREEALRMIPCKDLTSEETQICPGFERFLVAAENLPILRDPAFTRNPSTLLADIRKSGCSVLRHYLNSDLHEGELARLLCEGQAGQKYAQLQTLTIRPFCPVACGCHKSLSFDCPTTCAHGPGSAPDTSIASLPCAAGLCPNSALKPTVMLSKDENVPFDYTCWYLSQGYVIGDFCVFFLRFSVHRWTVLALPFFSSDSWPSRQDHI